jgi:hypothetical protein
VARKEARFGRSRFGRRVDDRDTIAPLEGKENQTHSLSGRATQAPPQEGANDDKIGQVGSGRIPTLQIDPL